MGALSGTMGYVRFRTEGEEPDPSKIMRAIAARKFTPLSAKEDVNDSAGWMPVMTPFDDDVSFGNENVRMGDRIALVYREDKYLIPRPLLRREVSKRLKQIAKEKKQDITEFGRGFRKAVEQSVISELRTRIMPKTKLVEVIWSPSRKEVRVFGKGLIVTERIVSIFERTFQVRLVFAAPAVRALAIIGDNERNFRNMVMVRPSLVFGDLK